MIRRHTLLIAHSVVLPFMTATTTAKKICTLCRAAPPHPPVSYHSSSSAAVVTSCSVSALCSPYRMCSHNKPKGKEEEKEESEEEELQVNIYKPTRTAEEEARHRQTEQFISTLLTTRDEQEWRDMLSAALRLCTWRERHLAAVVRGITLLKYNTSEKEERREQQQQQRAPPLPSTPTSRLRRACEMVKFIVEEGPVIPASPAAPTEGDTEGQDKAHEEREAMLRPSNDVVQRLFVLLLNAATASLNSSHQKDYNYNSVAVAPPRDVWSFLSWMELHHYTLTSTALLDVLETMVDADEGNEGQRSNHHNKHSSSSSRSSSYDAQAKHALASRRVNRLDFLKAERQRLTRLQTSAGGKDEKEHGKKEKKTLSSPLPPSSAARPRTEPSSSS